MIRFDEEPKVVGWIKVHHFWQDTNSNDPSLFRSRKSLDSWPEGIPAQAKDDLWDILQSRWIRKQSGPDMLRWGYQGKGEYTVKEAHHILSATQ